MRFVGSPHKSFKTNWDDQLSQDAEVTDQS